MVRRLFILSLFLVATVAAEEFDRERSSGLDLIGAAKAVKEALAPTVPEVAKGKPWEDEIAGLTSSDPRRYNAAISALVRRGVEVLPDLAVLAGDRDWQIRIRVVQVASVIGTDAGAAIVLARTRDEVRRVREFAALGLGRTKGTTAYPRLVELLADLEPDTRRAAAQGLALLGDLRGLESLLCLVRERDDLAQRDMSDALVVLAVNALAVPELARLIGLKTGQERGVLIDTSGRVGDPRLCPALVAVLGGRDADLALLAARALAANGDSRALASLCLAADKGVTAEVQAEAAATLRRLTGYEASPGPAWRLWWDQHRAEVERLHRRDEFLAAMHDPTRLATAAEVASFSLDELFPLLDGALGAGAAWWPAQAWRALALDDAKRWTNLLVQRIKAAPVPSLRLPLILILDQLGDPAATPALQFMLDQEEPRKPFGAERLAIALALERRKS